MALTFRAQALSMMLSSIASGPRATVAFLNNCGFSAKTAGVAQPAIVCNYRDRFCRLIDHIGNPLSKASQQRRPG